MSIPILLKYYSKNLVCNFGRKKKIILTVKNELLFIKKKGIKLLKNFCIVLFTSKSLTGIGLNKIITTIYWAKNKQNGDFDLSYNSFYQKFYDK